MSDIAPQPEVSTNPSNDLAQISEMVGNLVNLLGEVVGDAVRDALVENSGRVEQRHAQDRDALASNFEAALERQDARFRVALEQQAQSFAAAMDRHVEVQAENLKAILREVFHDRAPPVAGDGAPSTKTAEVLEDLQETLRLGFGEVRTALDRHHRELMEVVRAELRPLAKAALVHLMLPPVSDRPPSAVAPAARGADTSAALTQVTCVEETEQKERDGISLQTPQSRHGPPGQRSTDTADTNDHHQPREVSR